MFRNYFVTALRNLTRHRSYSAINIFGLMMGLTACLLIGIYVNNELSYDAFHTNADRIVRVTMEYEFGAGEPTTTATTGTRPGPEFKRNFPAVEEYARTYIADRTVKNKEKIFDNSRILYADPAFFKIFSFPVLSGDNALTALDAPDKIVITRSTAKRIFGLNDHFEDIINKTITLGDKDYRIAAVCGDAPENSQLKFDAVTQFLNYNKNLSTETWWTANWITYLLLRNKNDVAPLQKQIDAFMNTPTVKEDVGRENTLSYHLEPLTKVHLYSPLPGFEPNGNIKTVFMIVAIGLLILIIACANYTNLATAQSMKRSGEIGMRKVMGASKGQVFTQFIAEAAAVTFVSAALAYILALICIPYFNMATGKHFTAAALLQVKPVLLLILFSVVVSFFSGLYPAVVLSGTHTLNILKKGFSFTGGHSLLRKSLIVLQFAISVFLITYTIVILQQMHFMQTKDLGYDKDHVVVLPVNYKMVKEYENVKNTLSQVTGVQAVTASYDTPEYVLWGDGITAVDEKGKHNISLNAMPVDLDFTSTLKMKMVAGRDFRRSDFAMMDSTNKDSMMKQPYIINETLAKKLGWTPEQAIGRIISKGEYGPVVGVVKDFNFNSLHDPIGPMLLFLDRDMTRNILLRVNGAGLKNTLAGIEAVWKQRFPETSFSYHFLDEDYNKLYIAEQRTSTLLGIAAGLAITLACLGLFGLAAFTTLQRTKEIGIRRVLGANVSSITLLIAKNFLELIAIAVLIAIPASWWAAGKWLQDFAFRIHIQPHIFAVTAVAVALLALCTIGYHSIKAALTNPVKSLRSE